MRTLLALGLCLAASPALAQDFIHFKFDSTCTNEIINFAEGASALPSNGVLTSSSAISSFDVGVFDNCLAGGNVGTGAYYNRVTTTWNPGTQPVVGDLTMAWFMRLRSGAILGTGVNYLMGAPSGGFRLFTNGVAGLGLYQREIVASGGNPGRDFVLPAATFDVQAAAALGWVHVAMVFDSTAQTADWYINGSSVLQLTGVPGASITLPGPFMLGGYSTTTGATSYDLDEFVMSLRAYSAPEILALSLAPMAGDGTYVSGSTTQCGSLSLDSTGGRPSIGNSSYALTVTPANPSIYAVLFGFSRCSYAGVLPLPLDGATLTPLATGCTILADNVLSLSGVAVTGAASQPFAIPADPAFTGLKFYTQGLSIDLASLALSASNGLAISIGN